MPDVDWQSVKNYSSGLINSYIFLINTSQSYFENCYVVSVFIDAALFQWYATRCPS